MRRSIARSGWALRLASHALPLLPLLTSLTVEAAQEPLPPEMVALDDREGAGARMLLESQASRDFFPLMTHYTPQKDQSYCGMASTAMVLGALGLPGPDGGYTEDNLFNDDARRLGVAHGALTLDQLGGLVMTHSTEVRVVHAADTTLADFRKAAAAALASGTDFVVVNYLRSALHQEPRGGIEGRVAGHYSPLGAYHAPSDRFLVLDVNRRRYPPAWVPASLLFSGMSAVDVDSGLSRGYLLVRATATAHPPAAVRSPSQRLPLILLGVVVALLLLGFGAGWLAARRRYRRRTP